ncbi:MAG: M1 family peptidase [Sphingobacteriales bacterium]|nr:MAG: M1 family peptidase [Sphingobacteriales bacterium]
MKKYLSALLILLCSVASLTAQPGYNRQQVLRIEDKPPCPGYWQQRVHYSISAKIDEDAHVIDGNEMLLYENNSPDTLRYVYFHLYQNAHAKGSYLHNLEKVKHVKTKLGKYEAQGLGIVVSSLQADGKPLQYELDNTIMKVYLQKPLLPGKTVRFTMGFKSYFDDGGTTRRRMKMYDAWGFKHYNGAQWFPKICVYDRKFGWDTYQFMNKEFYGDFGRYEVTLDFPNNYVVEATGELQNRSEVLPDTLRAKLDVKNFATKKANEKPSIVTPYIKGQRKVWQYIADDVHDFAFTADPSYRIDTKIWNGVECVGLVQEPHAATWQHSAELVAKIIETFSNEIGRYRYPKMVAADAAEGTEYPMLTMDAGGEPGYRGLLVHEIAHNWFYGMVGNNETYRAALDEGFTQFYTSHGLRLIDGDTLKGSKAPKNFFRKHAFTPALAINGRVMDAYIQDALNQTDAPLNTHSYDFNDALGHEGGYRSVYFKTAAMLYGLQYTLGDSLYKGAMQHYFKQWCFAHPYFEDFRNSIIQYTHVDLNWFFDQWMETTKSIDYSIGSVKRISGNDSFAIKFKRIGLMQMPLDFTVTAKDGSKHNYYIPNTWFEKNTPATTLPKWYGWSKINAEYGAHIQVPSGVKRVQIDTTYRLADRDWRNNYKTKGFPIRTKAVMIRPDYGVNTVADWKHYRMYVRPDVWWNAVDGVKVGLHVDGNYFNSAGKVDAAIWFNTHLGQQLDYQSFASEGWYERYAPVNYSFNYLTPLSKNYTKLQLQLNSRLLDGLWYHRGGFNWLPTSSDKVELYAQSMWRAVSHDLDYLIYTNEWSSRRAHTNSSLNLAWKHSYNYMRGTGTYNLSLRAPMLTGNGGTGFNYSYLQGEAINYNNLGKLEVRTRVFGRYGTGTNIPYESALFAAGANPEEMMEDKYTRSVGFIPNDWRGYSQTDMNHFQQGGGLNLRGYAGYLIADEREGQVLTGYKARSGAAVNVEVDFDKYIKLAPKFTRNWLHIDAYVFGDAGMMQLSKVSNLASYWDIQPTNYWSDLRLDAGVGFAATIKKWWVFDKAKPLTLRFDMPFVVNRPPNANPDYAGFRYVIGVNRTF